MKQRAMSLLLTLATVFSLFGSMPPTASAAYSLTVTTGKYYCLYNIGGRKYLNVYGNRNANNTNVTLWAYDNTNGERFRLVRSGSGYALIPQCAPSRALNVYGDYAKNASNVCIWSQTGHSTQGWIVEYVPAQKGYIFRSANNKNLALAAAGNQNGSNVCLKKYNTGDKYQIWLCNAIKVSNTAPAVKPAETTQKKLTLYKPLSVLRVSSDAKGRLDSDQHYHAGIDYAAAAGSKITAVADGVVTKTGYTNARGYYAVVYHEKLGLISVYQHMRSASNLKKGQKTTGGKTVIGCVGNTGNSYGAHLHLELVYASAAHKADQEYGWTLTKKGSTKEMWRILTNEDIKWR